MCTECWSDEHPYDDPVPPEPDYDPTCQQGCCNPPHPLSPSVHSLASEIFWPITGKPDEVLIPMHKPEPGEEFPSLEPLIQQSAALLARTLKSKNSDYKVDSEFSNFERAAEFAGITPLKVMLAQIGIKYTRIQGLMDAENEMPDDSLLDLAGYAIIAHAYLQAEGDW